MSDDVDEERIDSVSEAFRYLLDQLKQDYIKDDTDEIVVSTVLLYEGLLGCSYFMTKADLEAILKEVLDAVGDAEMKIKDTDDPTILH